MGAGIGEDVAAWLVVSVDNMKTSVSGREPVKSTGTRVSHDGTAS